LCFLVLILGSDSESGRLWLRSPPSAFPRRSRPRLLARRSLRPPRTSSLISFWGFLRTCSSVCSRLLIPGRFGSVVWSGAPSCGPPSIVDTRFLFLLSLSMFVLFYIRQSCLMSLPAIPHSTPALLSSRFPEYRSSPTLSSDISSLGEVMLNPRTMENIFMLRVFLPYFLSNHSTLPLLPTSSSFLILARNRSR